MSITSYVHHKACIYVMNWTQITITTSNEASEAVTNYLFDMDAHGVELQETANSTTSHIVYFPLDDRIDARIKKISTFLTKLPEFGIHPDPATIAINKIATEDWTEAWKSDYHPQRIGKHLLITPTWNNIKPDDTTIPIRLDPGMAFGTGYHPTTRLSLRMLEDSIESNMYVADIGTGSGILAIAAVKLGALHVDAIELDPTAIPIANANFSKNGVDKQITLYQGDGICVVNNKYDLIVGNILTKAILPIIPSCPSRMTPDGCVIFSGILESELERVKEGMTENGMQCIQVMDESEDDLVWVAVKAILREKSN